jgi:hypothetical protein
MNIKEELFGGEEPVVGEGEGEGDGAIITEAHYV